MRDVNFDTTINFDTGVQSSVAVNADGVVFEVHKSESRDTLYYHIGRINVGYVDFGGSNSYGSGLNPRVAINDHAVLEVHETSASQNNLEYYYGRFNESDFDFGNAHPYGTGHNPSIATNANGVIVGIEENTEFPRRLSYRVGQTSLATRTFQGWSVAQPLAIGINPAIALNNDGYVVAVFRAAGNSRLSYSAGRVVIGSLQLGPAKGIDNVVGTAPSVVLMDDGMVILTSLTTAGAVECRTGTLNVATLDITWNTRRPCNTIKPLDRDSNDPYLSVAVAANKTLAVETVSTAKRLAFSSSLLTDRSRWMGNALPRLGTKTLQQLSIPGSHDAATYRIDNCTAAGKPCNTRTQSGTFLEQLQSGARYFDVRPVIYGGQMLTGHYGSVPIIGIQGCNAAPLPAVLQDVRTFMAGGVQEVVILKFSHYYDRDAGVETFSRAQMQSLIQMVTSTLSEYLYVQPPNAPRLAKTALNTLAGAKGTVLAVFDELDSTLLTSGTYRYKDFRTTVVCDGKSAPAGFNFDTVSDLSVYDCYAHQEELSAVATDQFRKLADVSLHGGDLFLFSWTLTQRDVTAGRCTDPPVFSRNALQPAALPIVGLAAIGDTALAQQVTAKYAQREVTTQLIPNVIYVDLTSGFAADVAIWLNQRFYLGDTLFSQQRDYLAPGDSLISSPHGSFRLTYQADGDLAIYSVAGGGLIRSVSKTKGKPAWRCIMQEDGNFVIYSRPYVPIFASNTSGHSKLRLVLADNGTLAIFDESGNRVNAPNLNP